MRKKANVLVVVPLIFSMCFGHGVAVMGEETFEEAFVLEEEGGTATEEQTYFGTDDSGEIDTADGAVEWESDGVVEDATIENPVDADESPSFFDELADNQDADQDGSESVYEETLSGDDFASEESAAYDETAVSDAPVTSDMLMDVDELVQESESELPATTIAGDDAAINSLSDTIAYVPVQKTLIIKNIINGSFSSSQPFLYRIRSLQDDDLTILEFKSTATEFRDFDLPAFTKPGTYEYRITESKGSGIGISYNTDNKTYNLKYDVQDTGNGSLSVTTYLDGAVISDKKPVLKFRNSYAVKPLIQQVDIADSKKGLSGGKSQITDNKGNVVVKTWKYDGTAHEVTITKDGYYNIKEIKAPDGYYSTRSDTFFEVRDGKILYNDQYVNQIRIQYIKNPNTVISANDIVEYYNVDTKKSIIEFDSASGPYYRIDYSKKKILSCTSDGAKIKKCEQNNNKLTLELYSNELPRLTKYVFNLKNGYDPFDYYNVYTSKSIVVFDTYSGPYYKIDYKNKKILKCTSTGAKIKKCVVKNNKLTLVVSSDDLPGNMTYVFDLIAKEYHAADILDYYRVDPNHSTIEFDSARGPYYSIDYAKKKILDCSSDGAKIKKCEVKKGKLTLVVYSDELPQDYQYTFDLGQSSLPNDKVATYTVYPASSEIEFDTYFGPRYRINYKDKKILSCDSGGAKIRKCVVNKNVLTLTVYSYMRPAETTYSFDLTKNQYQPPKDKIQYYYVYPDMSEIEFDSERGPYYRINYADKKILDCTSDGAIIKECSVSDNVLALKVYSDEYPYDTTYKFDLTKNIIKNPIYEDQIEYYTVNNQNNEIVFDTTQGPRYSINYIDKEILDCTSDGAKIIECNVENDILTLTVYSNERPENTTYTFDLTKNKVRDDIVFEEDQIEYYRVSRSDGTIEFDTSGGPLYRIDYVNKDVLACTSSGATIVECKEENDILTLTLYSYERPKETTYTFDLTVSDYKAPEIIEYYRVYPSSGIIEFDTAYGPYYMINYNKQKVLRCTSTGSKIIRCEISGDILTLEVYSDELPENTAYEFDLTQNNVDSDPDTNNGSIVNYYRVYADQSIIEFDTNPGPYYKINYATNEIIFCTSEPAEIIRNETNGNILTLELFSSEYPIATAYDFDLTENNILPGTSPATIPISSGLGIDNKSYGLINGEVMFYGSSNASVTLLEVPESIHWGSYELPVTGIRSGSVSGLANLSHLVLGDNVKYIGYHAVENCPDLDTIEIRSTQLTADSIEDGAFDGITKSVTVICPAGKKSEYESLLTQKGLTATFSEA